MVPLKKEKYSPKKEELKKINKGEEGRGFGPAVWSSTVGKKGLILLLHCSCQSPHEGVNE